jgi:hypothetical protein
MNVLRAVGRTRVAADASGGEVAAALPPVRCHIVLTLDSQRWTHPMPGHRFTSGR